SRREDRKIGGRISIHRGTNLGSARMEDTDGYLLFSDPNNNLIYRWTQDGQLSIFLTKSGYHGMDIGEYGQPGSNGLTLDKQGRLSINQHGNRRVVRMEKHGQLTILVDRYVGRR